MIDATVPADKNISLKEFQKLFKYEDLKIVVTKMWKLKTKAIPVVIIALGMIKKCTQNFIDQIPSRPSLKEMQKIVLTSTAHILQKLPSNTLSQVSRCPSNFAPWMKTKFKDFSREI